MTVEMTRRNVFMPPVGGVNTWVEKLDYELPYFRKGESFAFSYYYDLTFVVQATAPHCMFRLMEFSSTCELMDYLNSKLHKSELVHVKGCIYIEFYMCYRHMMINDSNEKQCLDYIYQKRDECKAWLLKQNYIA